MRLLSSPVLLTGGTYSGRAFSSLGGRFYGERLTHGLPESGSIIEIVMACPFDGHVVQQIGYRASQRLAAVRGHDGVTAGQDDGRRRQQSANEIDRRHAVAQQQADRRPRVMITRQRDKRIERWGLSQFEVRRPKKRIPDYFLSIFVAAASAALAGDDAPAKKAMARLRQITPELRISNLRDLFPIRRSEDFDRWSEGMRKAGLPE